MKTFFNTAFLLIFSINGIWSQQWKITEDHAISFANKDVSGVFKEISGSITFDPANLGTAKFDLKIKVESISTGNGMQNKHAIGSEWFNAAKFPAITFISEKVVKSDAGYKAIGKLEMHGIEKEITIPFTFSKKGNKGTFIGKFSVDRTDFGVGSKGKDVEETLKIVATIRATKK
jgi:polyisoprenoid-binding protein YceI